MKIRIQNFIYYLFIIVVYMNFQIEAKEVTQLNEKPYVVIKSYVLSEKDEKKAFESAILEKKKISVLCQLGGSKSNSKHYEIRN